MKYNMNDLFNMFAKKVADDLQGPAPDMEDALHSVHLIKPEDISEVRDKQRRRLERIV